MNTNEKIKERFRELVDATGLSKAECSKQIGISHNTFDNVYNYGKLIRMRVIACIADYFNISIDYLLGRTDDKQIKSHRQ